MLSIPRLNAPVNTACQPSVRASRTPCKRFGHEPINCTFRRWIGQQAPAWRAMAVGGACLCVSPIAMEPPFPFRPARSHRAPPGVPESHAGGSGRTRPERPSGQPEKARQAALALTHRHLHGRHVRAQRNVPAEDRYRAEFRHLSHKALEEATWPGITEDQYVALRKTARQS